MSLKDHKDKFHPDIYAELVQLGKLYKDSFFGSKEIFDILKIRLNTELFQEKDKITMEGDMYLVQKINNDGTIDLLRIGNANEEGSAPPF